MRNIFRSAGSSAEKRSSRRASSRKKAGSPGRVKGSWWFVPVQSTPPKTVKVRLNRSVLDEMAAISATPLGVEDFEVAVGVEGLRQDWRRVGTYLRTAMDGLGDEVPCVEINASQAGSEGRSSGGPKVVFLTESSGRSPSD